MLGVTERSYTFTDGLFYRLLVWYWLKVATTILLYHKTYFMNRMRGEDAEKHIPIIVGFISAKELQIAEMQLVKYV